MDKNIIYAFVISTVIIMLFYFLYPPTAKQNTTESIKPEQSTITTKIPDTQTGFQDTQKTVVTDAKNNTSNNSNNPINSKIITIDSNLYEVKLDTAGGVLQSFILKNYDHSSKPRFNFLKFAWNLILGKKNQTRDYNPDKKVNMVNKIENQNLPWNFALRPNQNLIYESNQDNLVLDAPQSISLQTFNEEGVSITKNITFNPENYIVKINLVVANNQTRSVAINPIFTVGVGNEPNETDYQARAARIAVYADNDLDLYDGGDLEKYNKFENLDWIGAMDIYFIQSIKSVTGWVAKLKPTVMIFNQKQVTAPFIELVSTKTILAPNEVWTTDFEIFIGPKEKKQMKLFSKNLEQSLDLTFDFIGQPMLSALRWFYSIIPNWGIAIIFLTILVRVIMLPLTYKGMKSMRKLSLLSPKIQALKKKFGKDKVKFNKEMMEIYKKHKVNPAGGCLPLLLQIPIFIALYSALIPAIELRHSKFVFWITDLSQSDFLYALPILMGISMYLQQKLTPTAPTMDPTQQKIMKWLPVFMTIFFLSFPASLVLYWLTSNIISIAFQKFINRVKVEESASGNTPTKMNKIKQINRIKKK